MTLTSNDQKKKGHVFDYIVFGTIYLCTSLSYQLSKFEVSEMK